MTDLPSVSVLLVTKNGERYLAEVLDRIGQQRGRFRLGEVIAVDSGSRDRTLAILEAHAVRVIRIPPQEFGHGKTRNLAASQAQGDYLVFLTQDATPANADWLEALLAPLRADPSIAGAYSRQLPRPDCHPMEWRRIVEDELSGRAKSCLNSSAAPDYANNPAYFYFFSNVSSVLRRSVWQQFPFPEVEFAEDQLWARRVLEAGYQTAYRADSLVYHSHGYGAWPNFRRHFDHARAAERPRFCLPFVPASHATPGLGRRAPRPVVLALAHTTGPPARGAALGGDSPGLASCGIMRHLARRTKAGPGSRSGPADFFTGEHKTEIKGLCAFSRSCTAIRPRSGVGRNSSPQAWLRRSPSGVIR